MVPVVTMLIEPLTSHQLSNVHSEIGQLLVTTSCKSMHLSQHISVLIIECSSHHASIMQTTIRLSSLKQCPRTTSDT